MQSSHLSHKFFSFSLFDTYSGTKRAVGVFMRWPVFQKGKYETPQGICWRSLACSCFLLVHIQYGHTLNSQTRVRHFPPLTTLLRSD